MERAKQGDAGAYEDLVRRYETLAVRTAYVVAGNEADAQDAAQEAFMKAYGSLHRFRAGAPFRPWILRIVANEARNGRRSAGRRESLRLRAGDPNAGEDRASSPDAELLAVERREHLLAAIEALGEDDQRVLMLRYFLDLDETEMAAALDIRRGTVKSRLSRALARLREVLAAGAAAPESSRRGQFDA